MGAWPTIARCAAWRIRIKNVLRHFPCDAALKNRKTSIVAHSALARGLSVYARPRHS